VTGREKYHRKAQAVIRAAEKLHDPGERLALLEVARVYLKVAKHVRDGRHDATAHREARAERRRADA